MVILIAGLWGGLIPFVGPYFHFVLGPDQHWKWTTGRLWLSVVPAIVAVIAGLMLMASGPRPMGKLGALLGIAAGAWFAIGPDVSMLWNHGVSAQGIAHGRHTFTRMLEYLTFHSGLGVLIVAFSAYALPGVLINRRNRVERDAAVAGTGAAAGAAAESHHRDRVDEREGAAAGTGGAAAAGEPGTAREPVANREPAAAEPGTAVAPEAGASNGAATDTSAGEPVAAGDGATTPTQQTTSRRRGGLVGLFSRR